MLRLRRCVYGDDRALFLVGSERFRSLALLQKLLRALDALRQLGSEVMVTRNAPLSNPDNFRNVAARLAELNGWFLTNQFHNPSNIEAHYGNAQFKGTGEEILDLFRQLNCEGGLLLFDVSSSRLFALMKWRAVTWIASSPILSGPADPSAC